MPPPLSTRSESWNIIPYMTRISYQTRLLVNWSRGCDLREQPPTTAWGLPDSRAATLAHDIGNRACRPDPGNMAALGLPDTTTSLTISPDDGSDEEGGG